ncbi:MAG: cysteine rich repeat-containing protein [Candidatus Binatia bacterium]
MRLSTLITLVGSLAATLIVVPLAAYAEGGHGACRQDLERLCPNVVPGPGSFRACMETLCPGTAPGHGAFYACLQQHAETLSPACQERLARMHAKMDAWRAACQRDVDTSCADVTPGHGNIVRCLRQHYADLSQACQEQFSRHGRGHRHHEPDADAVSGQ